MQLSSTWDYITFADEQPFDLLLIVYGSKAAIPLSRAAGVLRTCPYPPMADS